MRNKDRVEEGEAGANAQVASRAMNKAEPDFALLSGFGCPRLTFPDKAFINLDATHCKSSQNPTFLLTIRSRLQEGRFCVTEL
jgi:hypothetical protein